ncbi:hypothetical protein GA0116948_1175 [Chitinophaga costaii]|uniref:Uncharacterized protein n=1 Tax=Chitinophaga costaii TaxID=1335309 RepID=A0A1C4FTS8_9BACT|nr:hypothetical protein [Chitinophaga costaii]SCC59244.1 hypothetical protein GA0116948_1175 [Chitinophaga costaii]
MISEESLTEEDIKIFLKSYISTQTFSLRTGLFIVSMVCLLMTVMDIIGTSFLLNKKASFFLFMVVMLLGSLLTIVIPIWWGLKSEKFKIVFEIVTIPATFVVSLFSGGGYLLITNAVLLFVLIIVFIYKYSNYLTYKSELTTKNKKIFFEGVLTKCYKEDTSISARYTNIHTNFTIQDESESVSFSLAPLKILQLFSAGQNMPTENSIGKQVVVSFLSSMPNTLLSFKFSE